MPSEVNEYFFCVLDAYSGQEECGNLLDGDMCPQEAIEEYDACEADIVEQEEACEEPADGSAGDLWLIRFDELVEENEYIQYLE